MKHRSSKKVHFEDENVNDGETVDDLVENTNLGFVVLIVALFSINYLYSCITSNSTTSNSTYVI